MNELMPHALVREGIVSSESIRNTIRQLLTRYREYEGLIRYPGDWGERAFRFWLIKELFMDVLGWDSKYIVFGERYDVLFLDDYIRPKLYLETKKPDIQITKNYVKEAIDRFKEFYSIDYVIITNGTTWVLHDCIKGAEHKIDSIENADDKKIADVFSKLHAKNYTVMTR